MKSIKLKLVIIYLALVFIVMIISGTFMLTRIKLQETNKTRDELKAYASSINEQIVQVYTQDQFHDVIDTFPMRSNKMDANILNYKGQTIASTVSLSAKYTNSAIVSALAGLESFSSEKEVSVTGQFKEWLNYTLPVKDEQGQVKYVVFTRMDPASIYESLVEQSITLMFTVMLALVLTGLLGFLFANTLTGPIILLTKRSKEMIHGDLFQEIRVQGKDEIGQLTESFNNMARELNHSMVSMTSEKNKMEIVLHNMTDGVLAYDSKGALIHANFACQEFLDLDDLEHIPLRQMLSILGVALENPESISFEKLEDSSFSVGDKFLSASFTPYYGKYGELEGIVIVLQDVTRQKKLDDIRREFVANVSHEIRTPLTTIKSYTETLMDGAMDDREIAMDFLNIINSEVDRMALLVKDLLLLSRFDNKQLSLEKEIIDLIPLVKECIKQNSLLAGKKNQEIVFTEPNVEFRVFADPARINQVLTNIISNAIKYTDEQGKIEIFTEETDKYFRIYIKDSGIGIPREDMLRIFERFYRVDKARSREMGGTGLGLAIAKDIMLAHEGKILVSSELGKGTTMILRFNREQEWME